MTLKQTCMTRFILNVVPLILLIFGTSCNNNGHSKQELTNLYPWCIVTYDSLERTPKERIRLLNEMGFTNYAYDWRDRHLEDMEEELTLAMENGIEVISVWLWLNAKRDSLDQLSPGNERMFEILEEIELKTTLWLGLSPNFFSDQAQDESLKEAVALVKFINEKAYQIGCDVALYSHSGWFRDVQNQIQIIDALPEYPMTIVYNFHHSQKDLDNFDEIAKIMTPYLSGVNLNGVRKDGPKILTIGQGDNEIEMINRLMENGYSGPWGILGHIENEDVQLVLERNIEGLGQMISSAID